jgi:hypothetical protein
MQTPQQRPQRPLRPLSAQLQALYESVKTSTAKSTVRADGFAKTKSLMHASLVVAFFYTVSVSM